MTYYLVMNGAGRRPHMEEVDTIEDVRSRLETEENPNDIIVIEGQLVNHHLEQFLFLEDQTIPVKGTKESHAVPGDIPDWMRSKPAGDDDKPNSVRELPDWIRATVGGEEADDQSEDASAVTREAEHPGDVAGHPGGEDDDPPSEESGEGPDAGGDGADSGSSTDGEG